MGTNNVKWHGDEVLSKMEKRAEVCLDAIAAGVIDIARASMREPKHGTDIPRTKSGKKARKMTVSFMSKGKQVSFKASTRGWVTRRSAAGEAPAVQTSRLMGSATSKTPHDPGDKGIVYERAGKLHRRVGTNVPYGLALELGTAKMAPRPWLRVSLEKERPHAQQVLEKWFPHR